MAQLSNSAPRSAALKTRGTGRIDSSLSGSVHGWYRTVLGYSENLVATLLDEFGLESGQKVLDPFCGAGTTLVECMKRGIDSVGIDANPASCFAAGVKTNWNLSPKRIRELIDEIKLRHKLNLKTTLPHYQDPTSIYLETSGMLKRGWISPAPLRKVIAIKLSIATLKTTGAYKNIFRLALMSEMIHGAANVKFGPELYCGKSKRDCDVLAGFSTRAEQMAKDLETVSGLETRSCQVLEGDSRDFRTLLPDHPEGSFSGIITSPPYPAEHDYTRNGRLELVFLEKVSDRESLRRIKKRMIRSDTKGIYQGDSDAAFIEDIAAIAAIVEALKKKTKDKEHGFARLYPKVIQEYFGGMKRHLTSVKALLSPAARCAYIVGDQSCYLQVHIPTAEILSAIAREIGFETVEIRRWRTRWSRSTSKTLDENILILRNPG